MERIEILKNVIQELKMQTSNEKFEKIAKNLQANHGVPQGVTQSFIIKELDERFVNTTDTRLINLFIMEAFKVFGREEKISDIMGIGEINESKQFDYTAFSKKSNVTLPIELSPVLLVNNEYSAKLSVQQIADLIGAGIINYNFDIQREAKLEMRLGEVVKVATINKKNISEMKQHLLNDTLKGSTIYLNATPLTATDGEELIYNPDNHTLMITEGTQLNVLDGYHRVLACQQAILENPLIDFEFNVVFSNFTTSEAIKWQGQHSKATPWSQNRIVEMQQESKGAKVVKAIKDSDFELEKIIGTASTSNKKEILIGFSSLVSIIDKEFKPKNRREEVLLAEALQQILMTVNEIKNENKTFTSQLLVHEFISKYKNDYQENLKEYLDKLEEIKQKLSKTEFNFKLGKEKNSAEQTINKLFEL